MKQQEQSKRARLDRLVSKQLGVSLRDVRTLLAAGRITVDGVAAGGISQLVDQFSHIRVDGRVLQHKRPVYLMLNKPAGVVSATSDPRYRTVIDLLDRQHATGLHIAGRLDVNSTGLVLLTNDGSWSRRLASPEQNVMKIYRVTLEKALTQDYVAAFATGMYFDYEGITTRPATLEIISEYEAEVGLIEGRYHQIRRMFGRFRNRVLTLHRIAIGDVCLDPGLAAGKSRELTQKEIGS